MTHNQIAYQSNLIQEVANLEQARHNREQEANARYATKVQEAYNQVQAALTRNRDLETARHNREQEALTRIYNETQSRLQQASLLLTGWQVSTQAAETHRSNVAREEETSRHNRVEEQRKQWEYEEDVRRNKMQEAISVGNLFLNSIGTGLKAVDTVFKGAKSLLLD